MDELRESSLLFSLEGLLETERERVQREARAAERRREEERQRLAEASQRHRIALEREREARQRREALTREREQLDRERLEAMKRATVERARIEAEARVRLVEAEEQRKHELLLAKLHGDSRAARYRTLAWLSLGASLLVLVSASVAYVGWLGPAQAARGQRYESMVAETRVREQASAQALRQERASGEALRERVRFLESQAAAVVSSSPTSSTSPAASPHPRPGSGSVKKPCGDSGDPLDDCLR